MSSLRPLFEMKLHSREDLGVLVQKLQKCFDETQRSEIAIGNSSPIILLQGPMGVGKTEFVKFLCEAYQVKGVSSPSFAVLQSYENSKLKFHHVDLYRLKNNEDLESTGFWDLFMEDRDWIIIEWPERISLDQLPISRPLFLLEFQFDVAGSRNSRQIKVFRSPLV